MVETGNYLNKPEKSKLIEILLIVGSILFAFNSTQNFSPEMKNIMILFLVLSIFYWVLLHTKTKTSSYYMTLLAWVLSLFFAAVIGTSIGVNIAANPVNQPIFGLIMAIAYYLVISFGLAYILRREK